MRRTPRPGIALAIFVAYGLVVALLWTVNDIDYEAVQDSTANVIGGIVVPVALGALLLAAATTVLGWWRPAIIEERRAQVPRWTLVVPVLMLAVAALSVASIDTAALDGGHLAALALGVLLVGFSEELATRGLLLVGFRAGMTEPLVWLSSSLLFGLLHALNAFFGQSVGATGAQVAFAFVIGSALYVSRMATGTLVVPMLLHATWDFGTLGTQASGTEPPAASGIVTILLYVVGVVAAFVVSRRIASHQPAHGATPSPAT